MRQKRIRPPRERTDADDLRLLPCPLCNGRSGNKSCPRCKGTGDYLANGRYRKGAK